MKRAEIAKRINAVIKLHDTVGLIADISTGQLTDLFIELSNERCCEQRKICEYEYASRTVEPIFGDAVTKRNVILNAPLPEIK